ncbi:polysaccharide ABC transporter ATP-binding protein [Roseivirga sp. BDSF3-8]|uniref:ABC transporter ATP-binding protein n=1 Tax=Roseivirga sp. BDSF3-8 TaxID=3241598 RepID=UPI003531EFA8
MKAISVDNISKRYRIGVEDKRADTLAGQVASILKYPIRNFRNLRGLKHFDDNEESVFWALRDISFHCNEGEVLGVIGHNGAGKSTLLKILSRITLPSKGEIRINGRVSSLLEVGTGFHPDLTGRDNVYMNGTLLGMKKAEVDAKFDEIVAFSGVKKHIDTPIKRYSSGMKVRLAFSVAAHLEPEILIIDEVLAVGDQEFQRKCLGKMKDVAGSGRTVLFVSHNMTAVKSLCHRAILLNKGQKVFDGDVEQAISRYLGVSNLSSNSQQWSEDKAPGNETVKILNVEARRSGGAVEDPITMDDDIELQVTFKRYISGQRLDINIQLVFEDDILFATSTGMDNNVDAMPDTQGVHTVKCTVPSHFLNSGNFALNILAVTDYRNLCYKLEQAVQFSIVQREAGEGAWMGRTKGPLRPKLDWEVVKSPITS